MLVPTQFAGRLRDDSIVVLHLEQRRRLYQQGFPLGAGHTQDERKHVAVSSVSRLKFDI